MLNPNHPDPERLSALASGDTDVTADAALSDHVSGCEHCTALVEELGALRMSLADLPDLRPHRPLRLLPEVVEEPSRVDRLGGWARRIFAPVLTAGAALAMVGLIGTTVPALDNLGVGAGAEDAATEEGEVAATEEGEVAPDRAAPRADESGGAEPGALNYGGGAAAPTEAVMPLQSGRDLDGVTTGQLGDDADGERLSVETAAERSPWPMVLFTGVALMVAAALLRWILAPRSS